MMAAYVPDFAAIRLPQVCLWMFELEAMLRKVKEDGKTHQERDVADLLRPLTLASSLDESIPLKSTRKHQISETSDGSSYGSDSSGDYNSVEESNYVARQTATLLETFPTVCEQEVLQCLAIAKGDLAKAAQLIFDRQEMGESLTSASVLQVGSQQKFVVDDQELKNRIIQRYSFVDKDDDVREHRPVAPKSGKSTTVKAPCGVLKSIEEFSTGSDQSDVEWDRVTREQFEYSDIFDSEEEFLTSDRQLTS
ncbi:CUE domain-containing protein 2 [Homalodisca vitripennis]|nr:CUE domain-containing protein 2 [Homalodisca vitripennis]